MVALTVGDEEQVCGGGASSDEFLLSCEEKTYPLARASFEVLQINSHDAGHLLRSAVSVYFGTAAEKRCKVNCNKE